MTRFALVALAALVATPSLAQVWTVDPASSEIAFSGAHAGKPFRGAFQSWTATIDFDPEKPEAAKIAASVDLSSARTGDTTYDRTLPGRDWLDVATLAKAEFTSSAVKRGEGADRYVAEGTLSIRGVSVPVSLPFTLKVEGGKAEMAGKAVLQRLAFSIGRASDATGAWVSLDIPVEVKVVATRR